MQLGAQTRHTGRTPELGRRGRPHMGAPGVCRWARRRAARAAPARSACAWRRCRAARPLPCSPLRRVAAPVSTGQHLRMRPLCRRCENKRRDGAEEKCRCAGRPKGRCFWQRARAVGGRLGRAPDSPRLASSLRARPPPAAGAAAALAPPCPAAPAPPAMPGSSSAASLPLLASSDSSEAASRISICRGVRPAIRRNGRVGCRYTYPAGLGVRAVTETPGG